MLEPLHIMLISMSHAYELHDFTPLEQDARLLVTQIKGASTLANADIIMLPGSTDVAADYDELVSYGLHAEIHRHAAAGKGVFGICGGLQLMGRALNDPDHVRYPFVHKEMLGLLDITTRFKKQFILRHLRCAISPWGHALRGFESHRDISDGDAPVCFWDEEGAPLGYREGRMLGTYLHRCLHNSEFKERLLSEAFAR